MTISALTGDGVDAWFDFVNGGQAQERKIAEVDYDLYAAGEAALGWMNASADLQAHGDSDWTAFAADLLEAIRADLPARSAEIAHLKLYLMSEAGSVVGNLTSNDGPCSLRGSIPPAHRHAKLLINARVHIRPDALRHAVETALKSVAGNRVDATITNTRSFFPAGRSYTGPWKANGNHDGDSYYFILKGKNHGHDCYLGPHDSRQRRPPRTG